MTVVYRYVDDEEDRTTRSFSDLLQRGAEGLDAVRLEVTPEYPKGFEDEVGSLARPDTQEFYGVLLDMRLDQAGPANASGASDRPRYTGAALAAAIRSRESMPPACERPEQWAFPVVLLAFSESYRLGYERDATTQDMFDLAVDKDELSGDPHRAREVAGQLVALATGYARLRTERATLADVVGPMPLGVHLPPTLAELLKGHATPTHVVAQRVLAELLRPHGLLVDEPVLLARLGVDGERTPAKTMRDLLALLQPSRYAGVFHEGWPRWWWPGVEQWLRDLDANARGVQRMTAVQRVAMLNRLLDGEILDAQPVSPDHGTRFWTVCRYTRRPIELEDAIRCRGPVPRPWTEYDYAEITHAVGKLSEADVLPEDWPRLRQIREAEDSEAEPW